MLRGQQTDVCSAGAGDRWRQKGFWLSGQFELRRGGGGEGAELLKDRPGPNHMLQANRHNPDLSLRRGVPRELPMDTY